MAATQAETGVQTNQITNGALYKTKDGEIATTAKNSTSGNVG